VLGISPALEGEEMQVNVAAFAAATAPTSCCQSARGFAESASGHRQTARRGFDELAARLAVN
jgi:hypothetical protein